MLRKTGQKNYKTSNRELKCIIVGTIVRMPILDVDKTMNLLAIVTDTQVSLYKLCKWLNLKMRKL